MPKEIHRSEGRRLFGLDPENYDAVRPDYPAWIFDELVHYGALFEGAATLEIGPGTGLATRRLLEFGANPLTLVEPDERFADVLAGVTRDRSAVSTVVHESFEETALESRRFDLAVAATSFHWIEPGTAFSKLRKVLNSNGTVALIWNTLQDLDKEDAFHEATQAILSPLSASPSGAADALPFALDRTAREADARRGGFSEVNYSESRWSITLDPEQIVKLYEGFSQIQRLDEPARRGVLQALRRVAEDQFAGRVERNVTSCLYRIA